MEQNDKEELIFHYSREERIAHAPGIVKQSYNGTLPAPPRGFFKALVHTKSSRFMLGVLGLTLVLCAGLLFFGAHDNETSLSGMQFSLSAFSFEEKVYISIKTDGPEEKEGENIHFLFSFKDKDGTEILTQDFSKPFTKIDGFIRTTIEDYDILSVSCTITVSGETGTVTCTVEQK